VEANYLGSLSTDAEMPGVYSGGADPAPGTGLQTSISGRPISVFPIGSKSVYVVNIGNDIDDFSAVVIAPDDGTVTGTVEAPVIAQQDGIIATSGPDAHIPVGTTTAQFLQQHYAESSMLATVGAAPATILVGQGASFIIDLDKTLGNHLAIAAAGGGLVSTNGGNTIAQGGGNVIAAGGGNVIAQGGGNVIAAGGGNVIAAGGGNATSLPSATIIAAGGGNVISHNGSAVIAAGGGNVIASSAGSSGVIAAGGGNVIAAGGGNVIAAGGGN
jgi:hypothetical protein